MKLFAALTFQINFVWFKRGRREKLFEEKAWMEQGSGLFDEKKKKPSTVLWISQAICRIKKRSAILQTSADFWTSFTHGAQVDLPQLRKLSESAMISQPNASVRNFSFIQNSPSRWTHCTKSQPGQKDIVQFCLHRIASQNAFEYTQPCAPSIVPNAVHFYRFLFVATSSGSK